MTLATLRALTVAEQMPDWWIAHLDAYRKKYPKRTAAQYFKGLRERRQAISAYYNLLRWPTDRWRDLNYKILGYYWAQDATTAQLSAALSRAFEED